jgi:predicted transcriptional regulator
LSKLAAKQFYLEQLTNGPLTHKILARRLQKHFDDSPVEVRESLLLEDLIELVTKKKRADGRYNYTYKLTGKKLVAKEHYSSNQWDDGTMKSSGNAFNWRDKACSLFNKQELAIMHQKFHNNNPITIYSRA